MEKRLKRSKVVIGTRGSKLALWQAEWVRSELKRLYPVLEIELHKIKTTGDKILDVPLANVGGKGLFVKEIEEALLRGDVDLAVHSMKDVPTDFPDGLYLTAICEREDPRDALVISHKSKVKGQKSNPPLSPGNPPTPPLEKGGEGGFESMGQGGITKSLIYDFPKGATIGTSSLRRSCQLSHIRPDLKIVQLRGNLDTRLRRLDEGQFDAIIIAVAGVKRLGLQRRITEILPLEISLPAIGQGAIGIECRIDDKFINGLISPLNHPETLICVKAERAFLKRLEGGCQVPIAAYARIINNPPTPPFSKGGMGGLLIIDGLVGDVNGSRIIRGCIEGMLERSETLGIKLAEDLLSRGGKEILKKVYQAS